MTQTCHSGKVFGGKLDTELPRCKRRLLRLFSAVFHHQRSQNLSEANIVQVCEEIFDFSLAFGSLNVTDKQKNCEKKSFGTQHFSETEIFPSAEHRFILNFGLILSFAIELLRLLLENLITCYD
jgi:hypothetical protein